jgi:hypothetical protein
VIERPDTQEDDVLPGDLMLAFAPLHKRAFGMAVGFTLGSLVFVVTVYSVVVPGRPHFISLIANYFPGYTVSWTGALIGFAWGIFAFFFAGWFFAFCRNFVIAASVWMARTRAELRATRDFLDHI